MIKRNEGGMFVKGVSGNPGGRPKAAEHIRDLARQHTEIAIDTLIEIASNPKASDSARIQASNAILDRAWGKPTQYSEINEKSTILSQPFVEKVDLDEMVATLAGK